MGIKKQVSKSDGETVRWHLSQETVMIAELFYHKKSTIPKNRLAFVLVARNAICTEFEMVHTRLQPVEKVSSIRQPSFRSRTHALAQHTKPPVSNHL